MKATGFRQAFDGWHILEDHFGTARSAEASLIYSKDRFYLGVGIGIGFEGSCMLRLTDLSFAETGKFALFLAKKDTCVRVLEAVSFDPAELGISKGAELRLGIEYSNGYLRGYLNGIHMLEYGGDGNAVQPTDGWCGVWIHPQKAAQITAFHAEGEWKAPPAAKAFAGTDRVYMLDMACRGIPSSWGSAVFDGDWRITERGGIPVFSAADGTKSASHPHFFEKAPTVRAKISFEPSDRGNAGFYLRHAPDTAYIKAGFDAADKCWFIEDTPAKYDCRTAVYRSRPHNIQSGRIYEIAIELFDDRAVMTVDGECVIDISGLRQIGYGRVGVYNDGIAMSVYSLEVKTPFALPAQDGVISGFVHLDRMSASSELEFAPDGSILAVTKVFDNAPDKPYQTGVYRSVDGGITYSAVGDGEDYSALDTKGCYQSILKRSDGSYLQICLRRKMTVQRSADLIAWEDIGCVISDEHWGSGKYSFHTSSLAEYTDKSGKTRIFLPIAQNMSTKDPITKIGVTVHNTMLFYSDDGGYTWEKSELSTATLLRDAGLYDYESYAESKVVMCSDGSLRLYNSRNDSRYICFSESFDFGKTWSGIHEIRQLPCAKSSFSVAADPYCCGTYYLAWVNDQPIARGNHNGRNRVSLARSTDGKNWEFLCDTEHMSLRFADNMPHLYIPLFQIVDPAVTVDEKYVYVTYGISRFSDKNSFPGSMGMVHHVQCPAYVRIEKFKLCSHEWNELTLGS